MLFFKYISQFILYS